MTPPQTTYVAVPTQFVTATNGVTFAYRRLGSQQVIPISYLNIAETLTYVKGGKLLDHYQK